MNAEPKPAQARAASQRASRPARAEAKAASQSALSGAIQEATLIDTTLLPQQAMVNSSIYLEFFSSPMLDMLAHMIAWFCNCTCSSL